MVFAGSCTVNAGTGNDVFNAFVEYELVPNLKHGDIVVMDNLSSHKNAEVIAMIHKAGAEVWFTPPYCPEFNPIEKAWGKLKDIIRRAHTLTRQAFDNPVARHRRDVHDDTASFVFDHVHEDLLGHHGGTSEVDCEHCVPIGA